MARPSGPDLQEHESISLNIRLGPDRGLRREPRNQRIRIGSMPTNGFGPRTRDASANVRSSDQGELIGAAASKICQAVRDAR
jgi:hypothetical protein